MITDSDITIYHRTVNAVTRIPEWHSTQIANVHWEESQGVNIASSGLSNADSVKVFIPYASLVDLTYVDPKQYTGAAKTFSIQPGDYVVKGLITDAITSSSDLEKKYSSAVKVRTADNRVDGVMQRLWHIALGCE